MGFGEWMHGRAGRAARWGLARVVGMELAGLVLVGVIAASLWAFAELADEVMEGETHRFDRAVLLSMRTAGDVSDPVGGPWVEELGRDMTALGGVGVLSLVTAATAGLLAIRRKFGAMAVVVAAVVGGVIASNVMKGAFDRPRPELTPHGSYVYSASFPSGHSMLAAVTYLTLAAVLMRTEPRRRVKAYVAGVAVLVTLLVGVSRVYLGVHWPTDVLAGWTAGSAWAAMVWVMVRWLQRRGTLERGASGEDAPEKAAGGT